MKWKRLDLDEVAILDIAFAGANIAKHLVPAGMQHRLGLGDLALIFLLANRRMVGSEFANSAVPHQIQPRITTVRPVRCIALQQTGHDSGARRVHQRAVCRITQ